MEETLRETEQGRTSAQLEQPLESGTDKAENFGSSYNDHENEGITTPAVIKGSQCCGFCGSEDGEELQNHQVDRKISEKILDMIQGEEPQAEMPEMSQEVTKIEENQEESLNSNGWGRWCSCGTEADASTELKNGEDTKLNSFTDSNVRELNEAVKIAETSVEEAKDATNEVEAVEEKIDENILEPSKSSNGGIIGLFKFCCGNERQSNNEMIVESTEELKGDEIDTESKTEGAPQIVEQQMSEKLDIGKQPAEEDSLAKLDSGKEVEAVPVHEPSGGWCSWCCNEDDITTELTADGATKEEVAIDKMVLTTESSVEAPLGSTHAPTKVEDQEIKDELRKSSAETTRDSSRRGEDTERKISDTARKISAPEEPEIKAPPPAETTTAIEQEEPADETDVFFNSEEERYTVLKAQCPDENEDTLRRWASPVGCYMVYDAAARAPFSSAWSDKPVNNAIAFFSVGHNVPIPTHKLKKRDREALTMERGNPKKVVKTAFLAFAKLCHRYSGDFNIRASRVWHSMGMGSVEVVWLDQENHLIFCKRSSVPASTTGCQAVAVVENSFRLQGGRPKQKLKPTWTKAAFSSTTRSIANSTYSELDSRSVVKPVA